MSPTLDDVTHRHWTGTDGSLRRASDSTGRRRSDEDEGRKERGNERTRTSTRDGRVSFTHSFISLIGVGFFGRLHDDADGVPKWNGNRGNDERTGRADGGDATWGRGDVVVGERGGENAGKKTDDERAPRRNGGASGGGSRQRRTRGSGDVVR